MVAWQISSGVRRKGEYLTGLDQIGILDLVSVRVEDRVPLVGVAVHVLGDLRQAVTGLHGVALGLVGRRAARAAALHVREVGRGFVAVRVAGHLSLLVW